MLTNPIYKIKLKENYKKDIVEISFDFEILKIPNDTKKDDEFIFDNEIMLVNVGEIDKFTSDYIYQSKFTVFKDGNKISFGGYTPDWKRKSDLLKDKHNNTRFDINKTYHVNIKISKYRVYIDVNKHEMVDT